MHVVKAVLVQMVLLYPVILTEDRSDWIDPDDLLGVNSMDSTQKPTPTPDTSSTSKKPDMADTGSKASCETCPKCHECEEAALPLLRGYIKTLLVHFSDQRPTGNADDFKMYLTLSKDHVTMLETFVGTGDHKHLHDVHDILKGMINRVSSLKLTRLERAALWMEERMGIPLDRLVQFSMLGALASVVLLIEVRLHIPWRRRASQLIVILFVISIPWTWYDLYKQAEIKQKSVTTRPIPEECEFSGAESWMKTFKSYFSFQEDECLEYYEHLMVDPIVRIPPTKAIAVTFVRFFLAPMKDVGAAMSEFLRALLKDLPITLYPIAMVMVFFVAFMFLFMTFGYSIRLPFFLTIEKSPQVAGAIQDPALQQAITENTERTLQQLERLQEQLTDTQSQIADKLELLEKVQKTAIEYNVSSAAPSPIASPSVHWDSVDDGKNDLCESVLSVDKTSEELQRKSVGKQGTSPTKDAKPKVITVSSKSKEEDGSNSDLGE